MYPSCHKGKAFLGTAEKRNLGSLPPGVGDLPRGVEGDSRSFSRARRKTSINKGQMDFHKKGPRMSLPSQKKYQGEKGQNGTEEEFGEKSFFSLRSQKRREAKKTQENGGRHTTFLFSGRRRTLGKPKAGRQDHALQGRKKNISPDKEQGEERVEQKNKNSLMPRRRRAGKVGGVGGKKAERRRLYKERGTSSEKLTSRLTERMGGDDSIK